MGKLWRRLRMLFLRNQMERELAEEMEFHRALKEREVGAEAHASLGNITYMQEESRAVWIPPFLESIGQDLRYALRNLRKQRGFTTLALFGLALGIGLNTSMFTVINAFALRPWPVKDPSRMVAVYSIRKQGGAGGLGIAETRYLAGQTNSLSGMIATREYTVRLAGDAADRNLAAVATTGNFFDLLGVSMQNGRGFLAEEDVLEKPQPVAVLGYLAWRNKFGSDPDIAGKQIRLDDVPFTVVGVAAEEFTGTASTPADLWIPLSSLQLLRPLDTDIPAMLRQKDYCCSAIAGRLAKGVTREQAQAELNVLRRQFRPDTETSLLVTGTSFMSHPGVHRKVGAVLGLVFGGVTLVLLLACANVGNLLLARAAARRREITMRLSLGAGRRRVIRQLLTESLVLALGAGLLGIWMAHFLPAFIAKAAGGSDVARVLTPDGTVLLYTLGISILSCLFFGLAPALHATRLDLSSALKDALRHEGRFSLRSALLLVQVAISVVLLSSAGLLVRAVQEVARKDPGIAIDQVSIIAVDLPVNSYTPDRRRALLLQWTNDLPGLALSVLEPLGNARSIASVRLPGSDSNSRQPALTHEVSAGYFDVLRIPFLAGRTFSASDESRRVIIVNETFAKRFWPGEHPIGKTIDEQSPQEVIGVVKDVYTTALDQIEPTLYHPMLRLPMNPKLLTATPTAGMVAGFVRKSEPRAAVRIKPLAENLEARLAPMRIGAAIAASLGVLALTLATIGLFGVFAYVVEQRTREIGVRMALGAKPRQVIMEIIGSSSRAVVAGLTIGFAGALGTAKLLVNSLHGVAPLDPGALAMVSLVLATAGLAASYMPANRAARIDPVRALRHD